MYRAIEEYSLNAWPSLQTLVYDGWLLRFADGYTKRSNSINAIYNQSDDNLDLKIYKCEEIYKKANLDVYFKITPFVPSLLDKTLEDKGYSIFEPSSVKILESLDSIKEPRITDIVVEDSLRPTWLNTMSEFNGISEKNKTLTQLMLSNSKLKIGYFTLYYNFSPVACGIGVIENDFVGLYDIVTSECHRNKGFAEQLILNILKWANYNGATKGYLLVVQSNAAANRLYDKLNYKEIYTYWYRGQIQSIRG